MENSKYEIDRQLYIKKVACLTSICSLKDNWDGYDSESPNSVAANNAHTFLGILPWYAVLPTYIGASPDGGVMFEFHQVNKYYFMVSTLNDGSIIFLYRKGSEIATVEEVTINQFDAIAGRIAKEMTTKT